MVAQLSVVGASPPPHEYSSAGALLNLWGVQGPRQLGTPFCARRPSGEGGLSQAPTVPRTYTQCYT